MYNVKKFQGGPLSTLEKVAQMGQRPINPLSTDATSMLRPNAIKFGQYGTVKVKHSFFIRGGSVTDSVGGLLVTCTAGTTSCSAKNRTPVMMF